MKNTQQLLKMDNAILISIHPEYVEKILSGEKQWEFRRVWTKKPVDYLVIYSTAPVKKILVIAEVGQDIRGSTFKLWKLSRDDFGGISRRKLYRYFDGKKEGIAIQIKKKQIFKEGIDPKQVFGDAFRAPQSFQFINEKEWNKLVQIGMGIPWE